MPIPKHAYRRYALSIATVSVAMSIGFAMQTSEAAVLAHDEKGVSFTTESVNPLPQGLVAPQILGASTLPNLPSDHGHGDDLLQEPVLLAVADDIPVGILPTEESPPRLGCAPVMSAEPAAGALIDVRLTAPCHAGDMVMFIHENLMFHMLLPQEGALKVLIPALDEAADVSAAIRRKSRQLWTVLPSTTAWLFPGWGRVALSFTLENLVLPMGMLGMSGGSNREMLARLPVAKVASLCLWEIRTCRLPDKRRSIPSQRASRARLAMSK